MGLLERIPGTNAARVAGMAADLELEPRSFGWPREMHPVDWKAYAAAVLAWQDAKEQSSE